jgi:hypothetical protein
LVYQIQRHCRKSIRDEEIFEWTGIFVDDNLVDIRLDIQDKLYEMYH